MYITINRHMQAQDKQKREDRKGEGVFKFLKRYCTISHNHTLCFKISYVVKLDAFPSYVY